MEGNIARLSSLKNNLLVEEKPITADDSSKKRSVEEIATGTECEPSKKQKGEDKDEDEAPSTNNDAVLQEIQTKLSSLVGEEVAKSAIQMLSSWENAKTTNGFSPPPKDVDDEKKHFTLPLIDDKETRKSIHFLIKSDLVKPFALADTVDKRVRIWHNMFEKQMPNYGLFVKDEKFKNRPKKEEWPKDRPDYLKFVLYKENIDTGTAAKDVASLIRLQPKGGSKYNRGGGGGMGYAGMKDKRGCTSQFCTVYRKTGKELMALNREQKNNRKQGGGNSHYGGTTVMRAGHFEYVAQDLRLG